MDLTGIIVSCDNPLSRIIDEGQNDGEDEEWLWIGGPSGNGSPDFKVTTNSGLGGHSSPTQKKILTKIVVKILFEFSGLFPTTCIFIICLV